MNYCIHFMEMFINSFGFQFWQNIMSGALYGLKGFPLVAFLSACGATNCYILSKYFGREALRKYFPDRVEYFSRLVSYKLTQILGKVLRFRLNLYLVCFRSKRTGTMGYLHS